MSMSSRERRNQELCQRYLGGETVGSLARDAGLAERTVWLILAKAGVSRGDRPRKPRPSRQGRRPLSALHARIGNRVASVRRLELGLEVLPFAERVKLSPDRLSGIEAGCHDLSVTELLKIAEGTGHSIEDLVRSRL